MKLEIKSAVDFLSNLISTSKDVTVEQAKIFNNTLQNLLCDRYENHWFPEKPFKGSAYRCIRMNHDIDPLIKKAGESCGLDYVKMLSVLPKEFTMWVDPEEVSYRIGENGSIGVLYNSETTTSTSSEQHQNENDSQQDHCQNENQVQSETDRTNMNFHHSSNSCKNQFINAISKEDMSLNFKHLAALVYS